MQWRGGEGERGREGTPIFIPTFNLTPMPLVLVLVSLVLVLVLAGPVLDKSYSLI